MDDRALEQVWTTRLQPWLQSREAERRQAATRFWLIAVPGMAVAVALGWFVLTRTESLMISGGVFAVSAAVLTGIGWGPLARIESEMRQQTLLHLAEVFGFTLDDDGAPNIPVERFHELDLVYSAPATLTHSLSQTRAGRQVDVTVGSFTYPSHDRDKPDTWLTDFTGALIRIQLNRQLAGEVILTRQLDWFSELSRKGGSFLANRLDLFKLKPVEESESFAAYAKTRRDADALLTPGLADGLKQLQPRFRGVPLRVALVPETEGSVCYIAANSLALTDNTSILEPLDRRSRVDGLIREMSAIDDLVDLIIREVDPDADS
ncbi:hypothetical protein [Maricaulis maris]|uniref:hypothetical protein n=1 Tax=Maricaulis maris TaxID=74318 RepID=UPI003B8A9C61